MKCFFLFRCCIFCYTIFMSVDHVCLFTLPGPLRQGKEKSSLRNGVRRTSAEIPSWWRDTTQIWVVMRRSYGISALLSQMSFHRGTSGSVANCRLFSQAKGKGEKQIVLHKVYWCWDLTVFNHWPETSSAGISNVAICFLLSHKPTFFLWQFWVLCPLNKSTEDAYFFFNTGLDFTWSECIQKFQWEGPFATLSIVYFYIPATFLAALAIFS